MYVLYNINDNSIMIIINVLCHVTADIQAMNEIGVRIDIMLCLDVILSVAKLQPIR